jgi:hypothetical protein
MRSMVEGAAKPTDILRSVRWFRLRVGSLLSQG